MPRAPYHRPAAASAGTKARPITRRNTSDMILEEDEERQSMDASIITVKGKPRKTVQDAEAVERRRTQLRVAQRAFRKRRETTIDELREQVNGLRNANDDLLTSLRGFTERAVRKGLSDELAIDLFAILKHHGDRHDAELAAPTASHSDDELKRSALGRRKSTGRLKPGKPVVLQDDSTGAVTPHTTIPSEQAAGTEPDHVSLSPDHLGYDTNWRTSHTWSASPAPIHSLMPSTTIGFDETPFSNRIRRRALEVGYQIVANHAQAPQAYQRVFKWLILEGNDDMSILRCMQDKLSRSPQELLVTDEPNLNWSMLDQADLDKLPGLDESWFFPKDVEAYLRTKGITVPPGVWYVNAKIKRNTLRSRENSEMPNMIATAVHNMRTEPCYALIIASTTLSTTSASPVDMNFSEFSQQYAMPSIQGITSDPFIQLNDMAWNLSEDTSGVAAKPTTYSSNASIPSIYNGKFHRPSDYCNSQTQSEQVSMPQHMIESELDSPVYSWYSGTTNTVSTEEQEKEDSLVDVTLDIAQLMYNLLLCASCLGRSQGYRKTDIDRALRASVVFHT